ncbi:MAG: hypothetical protein A2Y12_19940 [Planctomycetes bacterium GWF2_42_9]|nr:MAG: hypothetical protein A2Y12_19940 [Planctomycetes bacterium GWF2_42_9]
MKPLEKIKAKLQGQLIEDCLFCPAIYEHKAALIGQSPANVSRSEQLLVEAITAEYETYKPDMLTVGIDIYNIEAEALGCQVLFPDAKGSVPIIDKRILSDKIDLNRMRSFDEKAGRISLLLRAIEKVNEKFGKEVPVRGAVTGPYSIAVELMGIEQALMAIFTEPQNFAALMEYCTEFCISYAKAIIKKGASICIFDSHCAPPLLSPQLYRTYVSPFIQRICAEIKSAGCQLSEYVIGGTTDPIAEYMLQNGFDITLSDFGSSIEKFTAIEAKRLIRRNISPVLIENGPLCELKSQILHTKDISAKHNNIIVGTGVISYSCPIQNVLNVRHLLKEN